MGCGVLGGVGTGPESAYVTCSGFLLLETKPHVPAGLEL